MASKVSVGKTSPVPLGQQPAANSLPVVFAEDQAPIPVEEQNKIQSEVALSLLGIPRAEVALGIFADVNTYDVNPSEWAQFPPDNTPDISGVGIDYGVEHVPTEAGARLVAPDTKTAVLTSKRFFRYQPGRVSASTMGVKMNVTRDPEAQSAALQAKMKGAPSLKKWGIFDKFDGYYFEIANAGKGNDFRCVRRTQAIIPSEPAGYAGTLSWFQNSDSNTFNPATNFGVAGVDPVIIRDGLVYTAAAIYDPSLVYAPADVNKIDVTADPSGALKNYQPDSGYAVRLATYDGADWSEVMTDRKFQFPFDQSKTVSLSPENTSLDRGYIRLDAHCNFYQIISNLNRKASYNTFPAAKTSLEASEWGIAGGSINSYNSIIANTWDTAPSTTNKEKKVWHLLVNTQGATTRISSNAITTRNSITDTDGTTMATRIAQASARGDLALQTIPTRTISNGNVTLKEWFNLCVPKPFRMVYEWRPPRAMFSGDKLDGVQSVVRWSDVNTSAEDSTVGGGSVINLPGQKIKTADNEDLTTISVYNIDFTKVTMWKIEFSWYGAVGAIFLCYVPVGNNQARWVRVHHIRASNQHSVASLGNATLPITYLTHGGPESGLQDSAIPAGSDIGNTLVKYGASYYIDGGDKGTVRLLSKASDFPREVPKGFYDFTATNWTRTSATELTYSSTTHTSLTGAVAIGLMGAYLESDSTAKVKWITQSGTDITLHFTTSSLPASNATAVRLIIPRAQRSLLTVRAKDFIYNRDGKPVRNRLQIYPIKYGAGVTGGTAAELLTLRALKNPLFIVTNSNTNLGTTVAHTTASVVRGNESPTNNLFINTKNSTLPAQVYFTTPPALAEGKYRYGYFLGTTSQNTASAGWTAGSSSPSAYTPILGKLFRTSAGYFFEKFFSYPEDIYIVGLFVPERHLTLSSAGVFTEQVLSAGSGVLGSSASTDQTKWKRLETDGFATWEDITRLSGVQIAQDLDLTPIPDTGNEILSYYANAGGYQFDLQEYFAYNKEYLSFPLTDEVDIINFQGHYDISSQAKGSTVPGLAPFKVNNALTWEEQ
jgi:hypothetical protein